jgi:hypothetical protein
MEDLLLESCRDDGQGLRVTLSHRRDRFGHCIEAIDGEKATPLFASLEGTPEQGWPPHPPLQHASIEPGGQGDVILGVGMAGVCHWSVSFEPIAGQAAIEVDVACRVKIKPEELVSSYATQLAWTEQSEEGASWALGGHCGRLRVLVGRLELQPAERVQGTVVRISPVFEFAEKAATARWKYRVEL